jgi:hypothetical protein
LKNGLTFLGIEPAVRSRCGNHCTNQNQSQRFLAGEIAFRR